MFLINLGPDGGGDTIVHVHVSVDYEILLSEFYGSLTPVAGDANQQRYNANTTKKHGKT